MKLKGRNLQPNLRGEDVKLLQEELRRLSFELTDVDGFFGSSTFLAVQGFQKQHRIDPANRIVDEATGPRASMRFCAIRASFRRCGNR